MRILRLGTPYLELELFVNSRKSWLFKSLMQYGSRCLVYCDENFEAANLHLIQMELGNGEGFALIQLPVFV